MIRSTLARVEHLLVADDRHVGVERLDRLASRVDLLLADPRRVVDHLALEVREVDRVEVDDPDRAHAGGREVERRRRTEAARADQQHLRVEQLRLAFGPDLGDEQVAAVADLLLGGQLRRRGPAIALALPGLEAAGHVRDVGVAHLLQRLRGEGRPAAAGAVHDDRLVTVRDGRFDPALEEPARHVDGAGDEALVPLGRLADVDDDGLGRGGALQVDFAWRGFVDRRARLAKQFGITLGHLVISLTSSVGKMGVACRGPDAWAGAPSGFRQGVFERVEREQRALEARRADLDADQVQQVRRGQLRDLVDGLALDLVGQQRGAGLADRAAAAGEGDLGDDDRRGCPASS